MLHCTVPTCGPQERFVVQVTVMCLFLTGCRGVKSLAGGHCVKSGIERKYQHLGLSRTHTSHTHISHLETFEETPVRALRSEVSHLYDL